MSPDSEPFGHDHLRLNWWLRGLSLLSGCLVIGLLLLARSLEPAPSGFGTHRQLGLPPCTSVLMWGAKCPSCGMTTAWAHATRGEWRHALEANVGGMLLAIIGLAYLPASCYFFAMGRSSRSGWFSLALGTALLSALAAAVLQWMFQWSIK